MDHPGVFLVSTTLGLDIVEAVGSPNVKMLYDVYHSVVMGEDIAQFLKGRLHLERESLAFCRKALGL